MNLPEEAREAREVAKVVRVIVMIEVSRKANAVTKAVVVETVAMTVMTEVGSRVAMAMSTWIGGSVRMEGSRGSKSPLS
jgi:hypothetical protein